MCCSAHYLSTTELLMSIWALSSCWMNPMSLTREKRKPKFSITWSHRGLSSSVLLDMVSSKIFVCTEGLGGAVLIDEGKFADWLWACNRFGWILPYFVLATVPNTWKWGVIEEFYVGTSAPQPKSTDTSPPNSTAPQLNNATIEFYTRTGAPKPSLFFFKRTKE